MNIIIPIEDYNALRKEIRDRAEAREWSTWDVVKVTQKDGSTVRRLIHVPPKDDQYKCVQIMICNPSDEDIKKKNFYIDVEYKVTDTTLTEEQKSEKVGVVFGRFCELLNRYFPQIKEYRVELKYERKCAESCQ